MTLVHEFQKKFKGNINPEDEGEDDNYYSDYLDYIDYNSEEEDDWDDYEDD